MNLSQLVSCGLVGLLLGQVSVAQEMTDGNDRIIPCVNTNYGTSLDGQKVRSQIVGTSLAGVGGLLSYRYLLMSSAEENLLKSNKKLIEAMKEFSRNELVLVKARSDAARLNALKKAFVDQHDLLRVSEAAKNSTEPIGPSGLPKGMDPGKLFEGTNISLADRSRFSSLVSQSVSALTERLSAEKRRIRIIAEIEALSEKQLAPLADKSKELANALAKVKEVAESQTSGLKASAGMAKLKRFAIGSVSLVGMGLGILMLIPEDSELAVAIDKTGLNSSEEMLAAALKCAGDYFNRTEEPYMDERSFEPLHR